MTFPFKLRYLAARETEQPTQIDDEAVEELDTSFPMTVLEALSGHELFLAAQAVFSELLQGQFIRSLEVAAPVEDDDTEPVALDEFLKARGADDCLLDSEETERQKIAHEKYVQLHDSVDQKLVEFCLMQERLMERFRCVRPLLVQERVFRLEQLKQPFQNLKRKINHAFVDIPGSYISKRRKRGSLPKGAVRILKKWLFDHFSHPYPSIEEKEALSTQTGLKTSQVNYWFINARVRIWKPMIATMKG